MVEAHWARRNAYPRRPPPWYLVIDRAGAVVDSLRGSRVGTVTDIPSWGCLVVIFRGLRTGVIALTDTGNVRAVTPEDDEASWRVEPTGTPDRYTLIRTGIDGSQSRASWSVGAGLRWDLPAAEPAERPGGRQSAPLAISRVSWPAPGGTLEGLLATPAGSGPFPLVMFLHGGPWFGLRVGDVGDSEFWTSRGAVLLQSDYAGSGILGEQMMWEPLRSVGMPDRDLEADGVIEGARHLVRAGLADPERLYVYGFSFGGYLVNRIVTRPHPFAAAACWEGPADVRKFTGDTRDIQIFFRGCAPEECPDRWDGASPVTRPGAVTTQLTIISGGRSNTAKDSAAWHAALVRAGARVSLLRYPDEDHVFEQDSHQSALTSLAEAWRVG